VSTRINEEESAGFWSIYRRFFDLADIPIDPDGPIWLGLLALPIVTFVITIPVWLWRRVFG